MMDDECRHCQHHAYHLNDESTLVGTGGASGGRGQGQVQCTEHLNSASETVSNGAASSKVGKQKD